MNESDHWAVIHAERARVADGVAGLSLEQWRVVSLCSDWSVEQVVAHLTAAANTGRWTWIRSIVRARFNTDRHNNQLLEPYLGDTPAETLENFRGSITKVVAPTREYAAVLGEVLVHGQDIARPLGIDLVPDPAGVIEVARFFATKNFAVNSRSLVKGLSLEADDAPFASGTGPLLRGHLMTLVMAMAGRPDYCAELEGAGADELRHRLTGR